MLVCISYVARPTSLMFWAITWPYELYNIVRVHGISRKAFAFILKNLITMYLSSYSESLWCYVPLLLEPFTTSSTLWLNSILWRYLCFHIVQLCGEVVITLRTVKCSLLSRCFYPFYVGAHTRFSSLLSLQIGKGQFDCKDREKQI